MSVDVEFQEFPKMARLSRQVIVSEKIDGTNSQLFIREIPHDQYMHPLAVKLVIDGPGNRCLEIFAGSRNRWITPKDDNFQFARWVFLYAEKLACGLGPGRHFGEWMGLGIQRGYGLKEKKLLLFNTIRWCLHGEQPQRIHTEDPRIEKFQEVLPECVGLVPVLFRGEFSSQAVDACLDDLQVNGSLAAPGFMDPEGVVCWHIAANMGFKKTLKNDGVPKSKVARQ